MGINPAARRTVAIAPTRISGHVIPLLYGIFDFGTFVSMPTKACFAYTYPERQNQQGFNSTENEQKDAAYQCRF